MELPEFLNYLQTFERERRLREEAQPLLKTTDDTMISKPLEELLMELNKHQPRPFQLSDEYFQLCFGFTKRLALELIHELRIRSFFHPSYDAQVRIPFHIRLLLTLSFLAHGHLELLLALDDFRGCSKFRLMQIVAQECKTLVLFLAPAMIRFPHTLQDVHVNKHGFLHKFGVPSVVGVLDCFFVRLQRVGELQHQMYTNRHEHTALNVQVICDQNYRFLNVNPRFPGATSDQYIWKRSHVMHIMRHLYERDNKTWLVADRGYRLDSMLMNPYRNATTPAQKTTNERLKTVRSVLDKAIAILKARFRCLNTELPYTHIHCFHIITACVTLHNFLLNKGVPIERDLDIRIPKKSELRNALFEDTNREGNKNREFLKAFIVNNDMRVLFRRGNSTKSP